MSNQIGNQQPVGLIAALRSALTRAGAPSRPQAPWFRSDGFVGGAYSSAQGQPVARPISVGARLFEWLRRIGGTPQRPIAVPIPVYPSSTTGQLQETAGVAGNLKSALAGIQDKGHELTAAQYPTWDNVSQVHRAPNGHPLISVDLTPDLLKGSPDAPRSTAFIDPKTNEIYFCSSGGFTGRTTWSGPVKSPAGAQFPPSTDYSVDAVKMLSKIAGSAPAVGNPVGNDEWFSKASNALRALKAHVDTTSSVGWPHIANEDVPKEQNWETARFADGSNPVHGVYYTKSGNPLVQFPAKSYPNGQGSRSETTFIDPNTNEVYLRTQTTIAPFAPVSESWSGPVALPSDKQLPAHRYSAADVARLSEYARSGLLDKGLVFAAQIRG